MVWTASSSMTGTYPSFSRSPDWTATVILFGLPKSSHNSCITTTDKRETTSSSTCGWNNWAPGIAELASLLRTRTERAWRRTILLMTIHHALTRPEVKVIINEA